nr:hypothetical protein [Clostridium neonatale]DAW05983.1 MAG TPA: putative P60 KATANIN, CONSERVED ARCHAEAL TRANSPORT COMPLEX, NUCLEOTIDE-BINDING, ESCRT.2A [Caudoviricetes sp.]
MLEDLVSGISKFVDIYIKAINKMKEIIYLLEQENYEDAFKCCGENIETYTKMVIAYNDAKHEIVTKDAGDLEILRQVVSQRDEEIESLKRTISKLV